MSFLPINPEAGQLIRAADIAALQLESRRNKIYAGKGIRLRKTPDGVIISADIPKTSSSALEKYELPELYPYIEAGENSAKLKITKGLVEGAYPKMGSLTVADENAELPLPSASSGAPDQLLYLRVVLMMRLQPLDGTGLHVPRHGWDGQSYEFKITSGDIPADVDTSYDPVTGSIGPNAVYNVGWATCSVVNGSWSCVAHRYGRAGVHGNGPRSFTLQNYTF